MLCHTHTHTHMVALSLYDHTPHSHSTAQSLEHFNGPFLAPQVVPSGDARSCVACGAPLLPLELQQLQNTGGRCARCQDAAAREAASDVLLATELQLRACRPAKPRGAFELFLEEALQAAAAAQAGSGLQSGALAGASGGAVLVDPQAVAAAARQQWQTMADKSKYENR